MKQKKKYFFFSKISFFFSGFLLLKHRLKEWHTYINTHTAVCQVIDQCAFFCFYFLLEELSIYLTWHFIFQKHKGEKKSERWKWILRPTVPNITSLEMLFICKTLCQNHSFFPGVWNNFLSEQRSIQRSPHQNCFPSVAGIILEKSFHNASSYCICVFPAIRQLVIAFFSL